MPACLCMSPRFLTVIDDHGWHDAGYKGSKIRTPTIDKFATSGLQLDQMYVQKVCSPTRTALMTGRYPHRNGMQTPFCGGVAMGLNLNETLLPVHLATGGYVSHAVGKVSDWGCATAAFANLAGTAKSSSGTSASRPGISLRRSVASRVFTVTMAVRRTTSRTRFPSGTPRTDSTSTTTASPTAAPAAAVRRGRRPPRPRATRAETSSDARPTRHDPPR